MRYNLTKSLLISAAVIIVSQVHNVAARSYDNEDYVNIKTRKLNGPRLGLTYAPKFLKGNKELVATLEENGVGTLISQFGWHFEWLVTPEDGGPSFVTQLVPFIGGVEYATVIPSVSLILGIRFPIGFEFGMGPNVIARIKGDEPVSTSLVVAIGQNINFGGVSIPLNLAVSTTKSGTRFSFVFGYAMGGRPKKS